MKVGKTDTLQEAGAGAHIASLIAPQQQPQNYHFFGEKNNVRLNGHQKNVSLASNGGFPSC